MARERIRHVEIIVTIPDELSPATELGLIQICDDIVTPLLETMRLALEAVDNRFEIKVFSDD